MAAGAYGSFRMPEYANPVDPPDLGLLPTLRRLLRLWWDQRRMGAAGLSFAFVYTLISTTIPILMQRAIDNAVVKHTQPLWPYLLVILALGSVRFEGPTGETKVRACDNMALYNFYVGTVKRDAALPERRMTAG